MKQAEVLGHPKGLFFLFFTEMWERFSYYGMRTLLVLYMTKSLFVHVEQGQEVFGFHQLKGFLESLYGPLQNQALSSQIYGLYTSLVYLTPLLGGIVADRLIGQRRSVYFGGLLMAIGHLLMAVESMFLPALLFLIFGNGFFKPNISTQIGSLYAEDDERKDRAYTIFYMGVNLGALFSPLICGTLGQIYGWHYGFAAAGIGMIAGLLIYHFAQPYLPADQLALAEQKPKTEKEALSKTDRQKIVALVFLCVITILFWGVYEQQGNTLQIWADQNTDWNVLGFEIPSTWMQSFNPLMIILFAPALDWFWSYQSRRGKEPSSVGKMAIGCFLAAIGFVVMVVMAKSVGSGKGSPLWLVGSIFLFTIGELYISPIGLSLVSKLAPPRMVSMLMGVWLLSSAFGNNLAGVIGAYYEKMGQMNFFALMAGLVGLGGVLFLVMLKPLKKALHHQV